MFKLMLLAGCGGFVGTCLRYLLGRWCSFSYMGSFPLGTFLVNIIGCFLIGVFYGFLSKTNNLSSSWSLLLITGFCGGFTTFSAFSNDMIILFEKGEFSTFAIYLFLSIIVGVLFTFIGKEIV